MLGVWFLVAIPTLLVLTCAILILVYQQTAFDVAIGVVLATLCAALGAGSAVTIAGLMADRKLAALQLDFVSKVSHELKTPLTAIRMFVETLQMGRVQDQAKVDHCLRVISKETHRLSHLIGRLLSWGQMESGAYSVDIEPEQPGDVVTAVVKAVEPQLLAAKMELDVTIADDLPLVSADLPALADALLNLLSNAIRYSGKSERIALTVERRGEDKVAFSVVDEGIGIELKHQSRIFDRFYRADERYARSTGGTGLGLAIARHIVLAHGGSIDVKSRLGSGSTFSVVLPVLEGEPPK